MKKIVKMLLLAAVFTLALSVSAFAAGDDAGFCNVKVESKFASVVRVDPMLENGETKATLEDGVYVDAVRAKVTFSNAKEAKYYLVVAQTGGNFPTADNVAYINQVTADDTSVVFDVYPMSLVSGQTYSIYISSNDGMAYEKVASFDYYAPYVLGDVENDGGDVDADDASLLLQYLVNLNDLDETQKKAADVDLAEGITADDASYILQYIVNLISDFTEVQ